MKCSSALYAAVTGVAAFATGCAGLSGGDGAPRKEVVRAVTQSQHLISVSAGQPGRLLSEVALTGLAAGETVQGIDYRVARGELYALGSSGRVFRVDTTTGQLTPVGSAPFAQALDGRQFGFDFNPAADRIRIVSDTRQNLRAHPDTGALVDAAPDAPGLQTDGVLHYAAGDANEKMAPRLVAAGYTYNKDNEKLTTNYAIDAATGALVRQGSIEGEQPVVSPNLGKLFTVGSLGIRGVNDAHFDIADIDNAALAVLTTDSDPTPQLYAIDLKSGKATLIGKVGRGEPLRGIAIEP